MTEKKGTPTPPTKPDGVITTQRNGQTIVAELFFNPSGTETFRDKLLKLILADSLRLSASDGQEPEKTEILITAAPTIHSPFGRFLSSKTPFFPSQEPRKTPEKYPYCVTGAQKGACMRTGLTKQEKTTDIWFDEKAPLIHIRTHNTDLKRRLAAYAGQHPDECRQTDADPETGCMEFEIAKGRFSFRLTAPYSEERREAARRYARENNAADRLK